MPLVFDEALDSPLLFDGQRAFNGGEDSNSQARIIGENQCTELVNVELDRDGVANTRVGLVLGPTVDGSHPIRGIASFKTTSISSQLVVFSNGGLRYMDNWNTGFVIGSSSVVTAANQVQTASLADKLYFVDGSVSGQLKYWEGSSVVTVATSGGTSAPAGMTHLISSNGRLFGVRQSEPDTLLVGDFLSSNFNTVTNSIRIGGDGTPITAICEWTGDRIAVFKESRVFVVSGITQTSASNFTIESVDNVVGALGRRAVVRVGADIAFMARDGVRLLTRTLQGAEQAVSAPISKSIQGRIDLIDISQTDDICMVFHENTVILTAKKTDGNFLTLAYDTPNKCWLGEWTGRFYPISATQATNGITLPGNVASTSLFTGLVFGDRSGRIYLWRRGHNFGSTQAKTYSDDSAATLDGLVSIPTTVASRGFTLAEAGSRKLGNKCEIEFYNSAATATIEYRMDNNTNWEALETVSTATAPLTLPFNLPQLMSGFPALKEAGNTLIDQDEFREIILRVSSTSGYLAVRGISLSAYLRPYLVS